MAKTLFDSREYWMRTTPQVQLRYWNVLVKSEAAFPNGDSSTLLRLLDTVANIDSSHRCDGCTLYEGATQFLLAKLASSDPACISAAILFKLHAKMTQCLFLNLAKLLTAIMQAHPELGATVCSHEYRILEAAQSAEAKIACVALVSAATHGTMAEKTRRAAWKLLAYTVIPKMRGSPVAGACEGMQARSSAPVGSCEGESKEDDLGELEKRVAREAENIQGAIRSIHKIKHDIQSQKQVPEARSETGDEEKEQRRGFEFVQPELKTDTGKPKGMMKKKFDLSLAINTEEINKEFDCGGEKGKKIVDEAEEERKFEEEVVVLAQRCVAAITGSEGESDQPNSLCAPPVKGKHFNFDFAAPDPLPDLEPSPEPKAPDLKTRLAESLISALTGNCSDHEIADPHVLPAIARLAKHAEPPLLGTIISHLLLMSEGDTVRELLRDGSGILGALAKLQKEETSTRLGPTVLRSLTELHAKLLARKIETNDVPRHFLRAIAETEGASEKLKTVWGRVLETAKATGESIGLLTEMTFALIVCSSVQGKAVISTIAPMCSDTELVSLLFAKLGAATWDAVDLDPKARQNQSDPGAATKPAGVILVPPMQAAVLMLCMALDSTEDTKQGQDWLKTAEKMGKYLLISLEGGLSTAEEDVTLLVGHLLSRCNEDANALPETVESYKRSVGEILRHVRQMGTARSSTMLRKLFPIGDMTAAATPIEEIVAANSSPAALEANYHVAKEMEKLGRQYVEKLRREVKNRVRLDRARKPGSPPDK